MIYSKKLPVVILAKMKHQFCSEWTEVAAVPLALNGRFESRDADKGGGESPHTTDVAIAYELT